MADWLSGYRHLTLPPLAKGAHEEERHMTHTHTHHANGRE